MKITLALSIVAFITIQLLTQIYWQNHFDELKKGIRMSEKEYANQINFLEGKMVAKQN